MTKKLLLFIVFDFVAIRIWAQPAFPVTDKQPVVISGLEIGYTIKSQEVKAVGDKGDFSRYAIKFYVTNTTNQSLIIPYKDGWNHPGNVSSLLVRFDILNATGARLTSNTAMLNATPYSAMTLVDDKDPHTHKMIKVRRMVQVGYAIQAGQTISADEIVIVPLNQLPDVKAICFVNTPQQGPPPSGVPNRAAVQNNPSPVIYTQGFLKFKNVFNNTYINIQTGTPVCSSINNDWWSAQWQLAQVTGTNYFTIKNRWKGNFIDAERGYITISLNAQSPGSMWSMEPTRDPDIFMIKNAKTGGYLSLVGNSLLVSNNTNNDLSSAWRLEQP